MSEKKRKTIGYQAPQFSGCRSVSELGPEFRALTELYKQKAARAEPAWCEKYASICFMYEGKPYFVIPEHLQTGDSRFACVADEMIDDLYELGAYKMFYSGMPD